MAKIDLDSLSIEELSRCATTQPRNWRKRSRRGRPSWKPSWKGCRNTASREKIGKRGSRSEGQEERREKEEQTSSAERADRRGGVSSALR